MARAKMTDSDYGTLAEFRFALRQFSAFSEEKASEHGLSPQQHQALLAIRGAVRPVTVGEIAERLILKPNSASELVDRMETLGLVRREHPSEDRRRTLISLTPDAVALLAKLTETHRAQVLRLKPLLTELLDRLG